MYTNKSAALSLALFLALVEVGTCLQCYHCSSQSDPKCGTPFTSAVKPVDCMSEDSVKYNQQFLYNTLPSEIFGGVKGAPRYCHKFVMETGTVVRTCLDGSAVNKEQTCKTMIESSKSLTNDKKVKECMVCDKDNCNGAGALSMSLPLSALTLIISYILYKQ